MNEFDPETTRPPDIDLPRRRHDAGAPTDDGRRRRRPRRAARAASPVADWAARVLGEINKVYIGQDALVRGVLAALLADGHVLIESVPGLGKTLLVRALGRVLGCAFNRIQFTPDLMPSDVTGSPVYDERHPRLPVPPRPGLHPAPARRRDQPGAGQDALGAAGDHAGGAGHDRRRRPPDRAAVPGHGDAEPDRVGGDVQPPRGPARPLPVQARGRLPERRPRRPTSSGCTPAGIGPDSLLTDAVRP